MRLRRTPVVDEVRIDGELVVMVGDDVLLVGAIGARLLELVGSTEVEEETVRQRLFAEYGVPEDPRGAWKKLLQQLTGWHLLDVTSV